MIFLSNYQLFLQNWLFFDIAIFLLGRNIKMYFKERDHSALYLHYQKQEQVRLAKKIEEIKRGKSRPIVQNQNLLPPITHRTSQPRPVQKAMLTAQTERLNKRILQLKSNKSEYFSKVIKLNYSGEWRGRKDQDIIKTEMNHSMLEGTTNSKQLVE